MSKPDPHWSEDTDWRRLGDVAARLKAKVEAAYHEGRGEGAETAPEDLCAVEHRLRMAERRRGGAQGERA